MTTTLMEKRLVDLQAEGKSLKTGIGHSPTRGDKVFLIVPRQWFGEEGKALCAYTKGGRAFSKQDSLCVWRKDDVLNAAVLNDQERNSKYTDLVFAD